MSSETIVVGYQCPLCGKRVEVLRSTTPPPHYVQVIESQCPCGFVRPVRVEEIQDLEVWREQPSINP